MKNKKKMLIIILVGLFIILCLVMIVSIIDDTKEATKNMEIIKSSYQDLTESVKDYNVIRTKYIEMSSDFFLDTYKDSHEDYASLMKEYNSVIERIDLAVAKIEPRCNSLYDDVNINTICSSYANTYEKLINLYVTDLKSYNAKLREYNEYKNDSLEEAPMIHNEYIDYNNDNIYEGSDSNEEN